MRQGFRSTRPTLPPPSGNDAPLIERGHAPVTDPRQRLDELAARLELISRRAEALARVTKDLDSICAELKALREALPDRCEG